LTLILQSSKIESQASKRHIAFLRKGICHALTIRFIERLSNIYHRLGRLYFKEWEEKMKLRSLLTSCLLLMLAAFPTWPTSIEQPFIQRAKLSAYKSAGDQFGSSVAVSGDGNTALVGAPYYTIAGDPNRGAVYVFVRHGSIWKQQTQLTASDGGPEHRFGWSVALSADGNKALVGAPRYDAGVGLAYFFVRCGTSWSQQDTLQGSDWAIDQFGSSVALSADGNIALVGAEYADVSGNSDQGTAYAFHYTSGDWGGKQQLSFSNGDAFNQIGNVVALSQDGSTALVGLRYVDYPVYHGSAYVFFFHDGSFFEQEELIPPDGLAGDFYGWSVALDTNGNTALVGADGASSSQGAVYAWRRSGVTWSNEDKFTASDGAGFGSGVAISADGNLALVGAEGSKVGGNIQQGAAYIFVHDAGEWSFDQKLTALDGATEDLFGAEVALSAGGNTAVISAPVDDIGTGTDQGSAYVFDNLDFLFLSLLFNNP
jgi:hypothetical protein